MAKDNSSVRVLVTAVGAPPGLNALRSLAAAKEYQLFAADADPYSSGLYQEQELVSSVVLPRADNQKQFLQSLFDVIKAKKISVILPCIEEEILLIAKNKKEFEELNVEVLIPDFQTIEVAANKATATEKAFELGLPTPRSCAILSGDTDDEKRKKIDEFEQQCSLPWIVKPCIGHGMKGTEVVESKERLLAAARERNAFSPGGAPTTVTKTRTDELSLAMIQLPSM